MPGSSVPFYNVTNTVIEIRNSPAWIAGGTVSSKSGLDGYLVFWDKPASEVVLGTTPPSYFVPCYGLSTSPLCRDEPAIFLRAISMAFVDDVPLGAAARIAHVNLILQ